MTTRRNTTRNNATRSTKKSLGNLLREEAQKETDTPELSHPLEAPVEATLAAPVEATLAAPVEATLDAPVEAAVELRSLKERSLQGATDPVKSAPEAFPGKTALENDPPTEDSTETLARLQAQLEEAQQQTATLVAEKADLEQRLEELTQNLHQEAQLKTQIQQQVTQLQAELSNAQTKLAQPMAQSMVQPMAQQTVQSMAQQTASTALTLLPRSAQFHTLALPRAFSRPLLDRPTPWDIPRRPLVITGAKPSEPSDLSDEDLGWFD